MTDNKYSLLLTSAIVPNTEFHVDIKSPELRKSDLIKSIAGYEKSKGLFRSLSVVDSSFDVDRKILESIRDHFESDFIRWIAPDFSKETLDFCRQYGKGWAELNLIDAYFKSGKNVSRGYLVKISGRYLITNIEDIIHSFEKQLIQIENQSSDWLFASPVSHFLSRCNSVLIIINLKNWNTLFDRLQGVVNDPAGVYLEKALYDLYAEGFGLRLKLFPTFSTDTVSGSTGKQLRGLKHALRKIFYTIG